MVKGLRIASEDQVSELQCLASGIRYHRHIERPERLGRSTTGLPALAYERKMALILCAGAGPN